MRVACSEKEKTWMWRCGSSSCETHTRTYAHTHTRTGTKTSSVADCCRVPNTVSVPSPGAVGVCSVSQGVFPCRGSVKNSAVLKLLKQVDSAHEGLLALGGGRGGGLNGGVQVVAPGGNVGNGGGEGWLRRALQEAT